MIDRAELYARLPVLDTDRWWLDLARRSPDGRVIEIGAGAGRLTAAFLDAGLRVTAVERDPAMLRRLRDRFPDDRVTVVAVDAAHLGVPTPDRPPPPPAGCVVLAGSLLNELPDARSRRAVLTATARCCRTDGLVGVHLLAPWWLVGLRGTAAGLLSPAGGGAPVEVEIAAGDFDGWAGRRRATLTYRFGDGTVATDELDAAAVTPADLESDLATAGLEVTGRYGAAPPEPFDRDGPSLHLVCRPRGVAPSA